MSERLVKAVVLAAMRRESGDAGWLKIDAHGATEKEVSLAIMEAKGRGLVKAREVTNNNSHFVEWRLLGPTSASAQFIRENRPSMMKFWTLAAVITLIVLGFLEWLIPVISSPIRK